MQTRRWTWMSALALLTGLTAAPVLAQTGTVSGQVTDEESGAPLSDVAVEVLGSGDAQAAGTFSNAQGQFRVDLAPGSYSLVVSLLGYGTRRFDGVDVQAGQTTTLDVTLPTLALTINPIVVTASRTQEKALEAPARVEIVGQEVIRERGAPSTFEHVKSLPGVDIAQSGLSQANVVARGFNNVFSGALLVVTDNRYASVPSLRVNAFNFIPINNLDLERMEVVLGPGAALYGPNSAGGVLHMITPSPIDEPGNAVEIGFGERSVFQGQFRTAVRFSEKAGLKLSGQYFQGNDWQFVDSTEVIERDFDQQRFGGEARLDFRPWDGGGLVFNAGLNQAVKNIELTGIGAGQADDWRYSYFQTRLTKDRFFGQFFVNASDAGESVLLRSGNAIVDKSRFYAAQLQHGFVIGDRQDFTYGLDFQWTRPDTEMTINGRNEDDDGINEVGGYIHSVTGLSDQVDLVTALRVDDHNFLPDVVFSPRAALVFRPDEESNIRLTYNRAFSTPSSNNLFLDLVAGSFDVGPATYDVRTRGVPGEGFTFNANCPGGLNDFCMRTPFAPGLQLPANGALLFDDLVPLILGGFLQQAPAFAALAPRMTAELTAGDADMMSVLRRFDQETGSFGSDPGPSEIGAIDPTIYNTFEVGYKGFLGDRFLLAGDVYYQRIQDFVGPLRVETPTVFFDPTTTAGFIQTALTPMVVDGTITAEQLAILVEGLTTVAAMIPIGTVSPDQEESSDLILTYRNFGEVTLWGADFSGQYLVDDRWTVAGTLSFVSKDCFDANEDGVEDCDDFRDVALNAPKSKGSVSLRYDDERRGFAGSALARFTAGFPMNSGVYVGDIEGYTVFDVNLNYQLPMYPAATLGLTVSNLLDNSHRQFIGAPELGRLALARVRVEF